MKTHYEPLTRGNMRLRVHRLLRPSPTEKLDQCMRVVETWEKELREQRERQVWRYADKGRWKGGKDNGKGKDASVEGKDVKNKSTHPEV
eukprot:1904070-Amphidinium_carterae.3